MRKTLAIVATLGALSFTLPAMSLRAQDKPADPTGAAATDADADAALAEFRAVKPPQFDPARKEDQAYVQDYREKMKASMEQKTELAKDFYDRFPDHPEAGKVMQERWQILSMTGRRDVVMQEADAALTKAPDSPVAAAARFFKAQGTLQSPADFDVKMSAVEDFIKSEPTDPRGGDLLVQLASHGTDDAAKQRELLERVQTNYADSRAAKGAAGKLRQVDGIGKPFELSFTDAVNGKQIDLQKDLKGKVVVVDFWATWCGPCVAEMPHMMELYSQWKDKGVEFVGISLDNPDGGLDALKKYVAENQVPWPQYYQGKGWQSEFSSGWGINSIPALFVVDHEGKLHSVNARGKLEQMVPELIAKRDGRQAKSG